MDRPGARSLGPAATSYTIKGFDNVVIRLTHPRRRNNATKKWKSRHNVTRPRAKHGVTATDGLTATSDCQQR